MRTTLFLLLGACFGGAQPVSFGATAGASVTQDFQNAVAPVLETSIPKRWIVGPMAEVRLPMHFSVEADAVYHELRFGFGASLGPAPVVTWEFPVLAKYKFSTPLVKPFVDGGPAFRTAGNLNGTDPSNHGLALGAGVEAKAWKVRISPQVRYIRWADDRFRYGGPLTVPNQVELLATVSFP